MADRLIPVLENRLKVLEKDAYYTPLYTAARETLLVLKDTDTQPDVGQQIAFIDKIHEAQMCIKRALVLTTEKKN